MSDIVFEDDLYGEEEPVLNSFEKALNEQGANESFANSNEAK